MSKDLNRNLEHLDAKGSIILEDSVEFACIKERTEHSPRNIIADQAEPSYPGIVFHNSSQGTLSILSHGVSFVQYDDFVGGTWICGILGCGSGGLPGKGFDLFTNNADTSFIRRVEFENTASEVFWPAKG